MDGKPKERWLEVCELASKEQNPEKVYTLVQEVFRILEEREMRLQKSNRELDSKTSHTPHVSKA